MASFGDTFTPIQRPGHRTVRSRHVAMRLNVRVLAYAGITALLVLLLATWALLVVAAKRLPPGILRDLAGFLPACLTTVRRLLNDPRVPRRAKVAILLAGLWLLSPIDLVPEFPTRTWGADELRTGEMWNSNSLVSWLLTRSGHDLTHVCPPEGGRAPGWNAGLLVARRQVGRSRIERLADAPAVRLVIEPPSHPILVDDVVTTGATIAACAAAIRTGGAQEILALAFAQA